MITQVELFQDVQEKQVFDIEPPKQKIIIQQQNVFNNLPLFDKEKQRELNTVQMTLF